MENSKEHSHAKLNEAIPTPHCNVINFRALRELLESTIELQTTNNKSQNEKLNKNAKKSYEKMPKKCYKKMTPIVQPRTKKNKSVQAPKNKEGAKQDTEVTPESTATQKESSKSQKAEQNITKISYTRKSMKKMKTPSIQIPKERSKLQRINSRGRTELAEDEKSNSRTIEIQINRSIGLKSSDIGNSIHEIDAKTVKSFSKGINVAIRVPGVKVVNKRVQPRNIETKFQHGDRGGQKVKEMVCSYENNDKMDQASNIEKSQSIKEKATEMKEQAAKLKRRNRKIPIVTLTGANIQPSAQLAKNASAMTELKVKTSSKTSQRKESRIPTRTDRIKETKTKGSTLPTKSSGKRFNRFQRIINKTKELRIKCKCDLERCTCDLTICSSINGERDIVPKRLEQRGGKGSIQAKVIVSSGARASIPSAAIEKRLKKNQLKSKIAKIKPFCSICKCSPGHCICVSLSKKVVDLIEAENFVGSNLKESILPLQTIVKRLKRIRNRSKAKRKLKPQTIELCCSNSECNALHNSNRCKCEPSVCLSTGVAREKPIFCFCQYSYIRGSDGFTYHSKCNCCSEN